MNTKKAMRIAGILLVVIVVLGGFALGGILLSIRQSVRQKCAVAQQAHPHPGDDAAALIEYMNSPEHGFPERNSAIWALGQLRATEALPALVAVYTGEKCDHENMLCQYELAKAIKRCGATPTPPLNTRH